MAKKTDAVQVDRRRFLRHATIAGAAALTPTLPAAAQTGPAAAQTEPAAAQTGSSPPKPTVPLPNLAAETDPPPNVEVLTEGKSGSDFMVDCLKQLGFEYIACTPGASFRALHESVINYGANTAPEFLTCTHEEISIAMGHGYAKIEGKPLCVMAHGTVGLQHASMAMYNAWCDRVPIYVVIGNILDAQFRRPGVEWNHTVQDAAITVRDFVKWDDYPASLQHFAESSVRAYKFAMTPPLAPVLLVADSALQEDPIPPDVNPSIPKLPHVAVPQGDPAAVAETAHLLVNAESPVLIADKLTRSSATIKLFVELAEALQCAVIDTSGRMNFPSRHPLNQSSRRRALVAQADVILGLELGDFWGITNAYRDQVRRTSKPGTRPDARLISLGSGDLYMKSNYQDFQRFAAVDLAIAADAEATLPALTEAVKRLITADHKSKFEARGKKLAAAHAAALAQAQADATYGWDASPISTARLCMEVWAQVKDEDWSMATPTNSVSNWPQRLWTMDKHYHLIGDGGGTGIGYSSPASVGAALANRKHGRFTFALQNDGDLIMTPGALWTAAHHRIPFLSVVHNNRAYHQEVMHVERMAARHQRGIDRVHIGTTLQQPHIDYAKLAQSLGVHGEGPITDPNELGPALKRAIAVVKSGEPALVDVVTQPR